MTILGAGGAATAMICQAALEGVAKIHIFSRAGPRFEQMKEKIKDIQKQTSCSVTLSNFYDDEYFKKLVNVSDILVNATSIGMKESESPITDFSVIREDLVVYDAIYQPRESYFLKQAKKHGARTTLNGLGMLLYQGAASFELWTHKKMPVKKIQTILEEI